MTSDKDQFLSCAQCVLMVRELEKRIEQRFELEHEARRILASIMDDRLKQMNEFRAENLADRGSYVRDDAYEVRQSVTEEKIAMLQGWQQRLLGVGLMGGLMVALIAGAIGALLGHMVFKG